MSFTSVAAAGTVQHSTCGLWVRQARAQHGHSCAGVVQHAGYRLSFYFGVPWLQVAEIGKQEVVWGKVDIVKLNEIEERSYTSPASRNSLKERGIPWKCI